MSDLTREAGQISEALRIAACVAVIQLRADNGWGEVTDGQIVDVVLAAFLASPPDWLTEAVAVAHRHGGCRVNFHTVRCASVPPSLRSAAGLETPS